MEKVALALDENKTTSHFGHCDTFALYDIEQGEIKACETVKNPAHKPGFLPKFLKELGVNTVITDRMGERALTLLACEDIKTLTGIKGKDEDIIAEYLAGNLVSKGTACHAHEHAHECGGHHHN